MVEGPKLRNLTGCIKNRNELVSKGNRLGRRLAIEIIDFAMMKMDAFQAASRLIRFEEVEHRLIVGNVQYNLEEQVKIYVVGAGKATFPMALAINKILGNRIEDGVVIVKNGQIPNKRMNLGHIRVMAGSHPISDVSGLKATREILKIAGRANKDDIVFSLISGGASALMPMPDGEISFREERATTKLLLNLGISVEEINSVRNHISSVKGGKLALKIHPAKIINLIIVDQLEPVPWGPTVPDTTTAADAVQILRRYNIWSKVPSSVRAHLSRALKNPSFDTPKYKDFREIRSETFILGDNAAICREAERRAKELGLNALVLTSVLEGESKPAGIVLGSIARGLEYGKISNLLKPPCTLIAGGESTVEIPKSHPVGSGGPSQELVLGAALKISGSKRIVIASMDTDGTDGFTNVAGGIVDGYTLKRARRKHIDLHRELSRHNSNFVLSSLGDTIKTGMTNTNVMDLNVIVITDK
jgi:glycerate 2-kinase